MSLQTMDSTYFNFPAQKSFYKGKVRDVYNIANRYLVMIATDRISAFDVVLPRGIPYKGQVLNQIASYFLDETRNIVPNWKIESPDPVVTIGRLCQPFPVEMVIRGYLTGSAWRAYNSGVRNICGNQLPDNMKVNQRFDEPIITPSTKATEGHDQDISPKEIIQTGLMTLEQYNQIEKYTRQLFLYGSQVASKQGLILVDTKYEFGSTDGEIFLIDEIHTPDSSRYFIANSYNEKFEAGENQKQLSKEFVREWLLQNGFKGLTGQIVPDMSDRLIQSISERYIELFETVTGNKFVKADYNGAINRIEANILGFLASKGIY